MRAIISGTGHYVPEKRMTNQDFEKIVDTSDEWIVTRTGIKERRILPEGKGTSFMATEAARIALRESGIDASDIGLIILATVTPDMPVPSAVSILQKELNTSHCWGFDLNGGCSGFLFALAVAEQYIRTGTHRHVLVVGADKMSSIVDYEDRNTCVLFGDGAGAVVVSAGTDDDHGILEVDLHLDGEGIDLLHIKAGGSLMPASHETVDNRWHYVYQDGQPVFKKAIKGMVDVSKKLLDRRGLAPVELKYLIPHQANARIIRAVGEKLGLRPDQVVINIDKYGNTTAATIPIALSELRGTGCISRGDWVMFTTFGAGFTWGSMLLRWA